MIALLSLTSYAVVRQTESVFRKSWRRSARFALLQVSAGSEPVRLTPSGRRQLAVEADEWERMVAAIGRVMKLA